MESATFRKWLVEQGCRIDHGEHDQRHKGPVMVTVHREGRKAEVPLGQSHQILDARLVPAPAKNWDSIRHNCPDRKTESDDGGIMIEHTTADERHDVRIPPLGLAGILQIPNNAYALVVFAHGSGSSRLSPRNTAVADSLNDRGIATLLFDLLTAAEEADRANVFDIPLLADRLADAIRWLGGQASVAKLPLGLFGASTGAVAALVAAAKLPRRVGAVVSRGGRPDLAGDALEKVEAPTLLIVGGADFGVIELNEQALARLRGPKALEIVPGASHLFPEPGALEAVIDFAASWFERYLAPTAPERTRAAG